MEEGVIFTETAADEIAEGVQWDRNHRGSRGHDAQPPPATETVFARTTSSTADADGNYPAVITAYSAGPTAGWVDYGAVKVRPMMGELMYTGTRMAVRPAGKNTSGDSVYAAISVGVTAKWDTLGHTITDIDSNTWPTFTYPQVQDFQFYPYGQVSGYLTNGLRVSVSGTRIQIGLTFANEVDGGAVSTSTQLFVGNKSFRDAVTVQGTLYIPDGTPASATASGSGGSLMFDNNYLYVCVSTNTWKRVELLSW